MKHCRNYLFQAPWVYIYYNSEIRLVMNYSYGISYIVFLTRFMFAFQFEEYCKLEGHTGSINTIDAVTFGTANTEGTIGQYWLNLKINHFKDEHFQ